MKTSTLLTSLLYLTTFTNALPPQSVGSNSRDLLTIPDASNFDPTLFNHLEKRRGGGGGKGGSGSSGGKGGSGSGSGGRTPGPSNSFSSSSNLGGRTRDGSGSPPAYGGRYYGGAAVPYTAGGRRGNITPFLLPIGALAFFPAGLWLYSVYAYPFGGYGGYHWQDGNGRNRTANVTCLCQEYSVCGCEEPTNGNDTAIAQQLTNGTGTGAPINSTQVKIVDYGNGNTTAYINGTLENGTTAAGGTDPSNADELNGAARLLQNYSGYWIMAVVVGMLVNIA